MILIDSVCVCLGSEHKPDSFQDMPCSYLADALKDIVTTPCNCKQNSANRLGKVSVFACRPTWQEESSFETKPSV